MIPKTKIALTLAGLLAAATAFAQEYNIRDFGAVSDGITLNTASIQKTIDRAANNGGGKVIVPSGTFLTGTIRLKKGVELHLDEGAVLLGSPLWKQYEKNRWYALILAADADHIAITGKGIIDGQGRDLAKDVRRMVDEGILQDKLSHDRPDEKYRPQLIEITHCDHVTIKGITLKNASCWVETYRNCSNLVIDSLTVRSTAYWNNDGMDIVDCNGATITNCDVDAADDGICLKSADSSHFCENIIIRHCKIRSSATALKFGTPSHGGFRKINISDLFIYDTYRTAIALETVDGGIIEDIDIRDIIANNTGGAFFLRIGQRQQEARPGILRRVLLKDITVDVPLTKPDAGYDMAGPPVKAPHNPFPSSIVGLPGAAIESVTLENIDIRYSGGGNPATARVTPDNLSAIPEAAQDYPEFSMFGELPAWGIYIRHAANIKMNNVTFTIKKEDYRPVFVFDDVKKITLDTIVVPAVVASPAMVLKQVSGETFSSAGFIRPDKSNVKIY